MMMNEIELKLENIDRKIEITNKFLFKIFDELHQINLRLKKGN